MKVKLIFETDSNSDEYLDDREEMMEIMNIRRYISALHNIQNELRSIVKYQLCSTDDLEETRNLITNLYREFVEEYRDILD